MATLASKTFTVDISDATEPISRTSRRIIINADILKQTKVYAGDVIAITSSQSPKVSAPTIPRAHLDGPGPW